MNVNGIEYITEKEASSRYPRSRSWFQKQRLRKNKLAKNNTIPFHKLRGKGTVYYAVHEIDEWFKKNINNY